MTSDRPWLVTVFNRMKSFTQHHWSQFTSAIETYWKKRGEPLEEMTLMPIEKPQKQWVIVETLDTHQTNKVKLVEVEFFPNEKKNHFRNYTIEGDDPNLRITHFPPSNRVH